MNHSTNHSSGLCRTARFLLKGSGQVMFQGNVWAGFFFLLGIYWGAYESGTPQVAWGALVGLSASTLAGYMLHEPLREGAEGLWGFNGILVGCAFPTFLTPTPLMWLALILCAMLTVWVRTGFNRVMKPWKVNSLTFPFVFTTWLFLLASRNLGGMPPESLAAPELTTHLFTGVNLTVGSLLIYWLKGIAQVFLINSWITGLLFLIGLFIANRKAAMWAAAGSALALGTVILYRGAGSDIAGGLYGFSPVLTAIALGCTFHKPGLLSGMWAVCGIIVTVFIQAGMDTLCLPFGLPTLTAPFCLVTWLFLLPLYNVDRPFPDHSQWHHKAFK